MKRPHPLSVQARPLRVGIVDVGTNSLHLVIGVLGPDGTFRVILRERDLTRLGERGLTNGVLTQTAMRRAMTVLQRYAATLMRCEVGRVEAVATSAVREASNGEVFVRRVRARLGIPLRVISGREEARLSYLGIRQARRFRQTAVMIAIGGGSTQVMVGDGRRLRYATSLPLGCAHLAQRFLRHDPPRPREVGALTRHLRRAFSPVIRTIRRYRWREAMGSSATIHQVISAASQWAARQPPKTRPSSISLPSLSRFIQWLLTSTAAQRRRLPGLDPQRQDLALPTAMTLLVWMTGCGIQTIRSAPGSLREGLVRESMRRSTRQSRRRLKRSV